MAARILPYWGDITAPDKSLAEASKQFGQRQIDRLYVVGSNATTAPIIEASYKRFLRLFTRHLERHPFLMGKRPGASDFAVFGQLTQLAQFDPTSSGIACNRLRESIRGFRSLKICPAWNRNRNTGSRTQTCRKHFWHCLRKWGEPTCRSCWPTRPPFKPESRRWNAWSMTNPGGKRLFPIRLTA